MLAVLLMVTPFRKYCAELEEPLVLLEMKARGNYLDMVAARENVKIHLNRAMEIAIDQPDVDAPARIEEVRIELQAALDAASFVE